MLATILATTASYTSPQPLPSPVPHSLPLPLTLPGPFHDLDRGASDSKNTFHKNQHHLDPKYIYLELQEDLKKKAVRGGGSGSLAGRETDGTDSSGCARSVVVENSHG